MSENQRLRDNVTIKELSVTQTQVYKH